MLSFLLCELVEAAQESSDDMRIAGAASQFLVTEDIRITNRVRLAYPVLKVLNYLEFLELFISLEK